MSLETEMPATPSPRRRGEPAAGRPAESRSWESAPTTAAEAQSNPSLNLRLWNTNGMTVVVDRVRAAPAVTPTLSGTLGQNAMGLGVWGTFFPHSVNRFLGMDANPQLVRLVFGLREFYTAFSLVGDPTRKETLWARVAGDIFDIGVLRSLDRPGNPKRGNVRLALGVVLAVTALDALAAWRMTTVQRNCV